MRQVATRGGASSRRVRLVVLVILLCAGVHAAVLLAVPGAEARSYPWLTTVPDLVGGAGVVVLAFRRARVDPAVRGIWSWLGAALSCYVAAGAVTAGIAHGLLPDGARAASTLAWGGFYLLLYVTLLARVRQRAQRVQTSMSLDGLVAALAVTAVVVAFALDPLVRLAGGDTAAVLAALVAPLVDVLLLALLTAMMTMAGRDVGRAGWLVMGALAAFAATDVLWALQTARGTYADGGVLDLGWVLAHTCLALAACLPMSAAPATRSDSFAVVAVPASAAFTALGLLFAATVVEVPRTGQWLALLTLSIALLRTGLTFRELRSLPELRREARTDQLTGLPNRREFYEALGAGTDDERPRAGCAVLMIDLDHFKDVNDSLGHHVGDQLLRVVASRLKALVRRGDLLARLGGDEFAVLARVASVEEAQALGQRLRTSLSEPFLLGGLSLNIDASVGVAVPSGPAGGDELLQMADIAMYAAKARRGGTHVYDEERDGQVRNRLHLVERLRAGIDNGELVLHYQPKLDLRTGCVSGVEALVRWQHPTEGLLAPYHFIELAESSGLMGPLTLEVLDQALDQVARWRADGLDLHVAVNVSPWNLMDAGFPAQVRKLLARHRVPGQSLVLEVTETLLMEDREQAIDVLTGLRRAGATIAVDDYGSGYSSLAYLAELPIDELKLDRMFASSMTETDRTAAIVTSTVKLAHALGLVLVAEGVEDAQVLAALVAEGCDMAQGYFLSAPVPADEIHHACAAAVQAAATSATDAAAGAVAQA